MKENVHAFGEDIFNIVEEFGEGGVKCYKLVFKNKDKTQLNVSFNNRESASWEADRWVRLNQNHPLVHDILFEKTMLT